VTVTVKHEAGAGPKSVVATRIDAQHGNSLQAWSDMGAPAGPSAAQLLRLMAASVVAPTPIAHSTRGSSTTIAVPMTADGCVRLNFA
jgi:beta-xylosidase